MKTFLVSIPILYLSICIILYLIQEKFIFHPVKLNADYKFTSFEHAEERYFNIEQGHQTHALYFKVPNPKGVVLYFHGNSGALDDWGYAAEDFTRLGYVVMMPDYPGYGKSTGSISEENINASAEYVYRSLLKDWAPEKIILYGRSLGTGVATELATKVNAKLLILETPYTSIPDMASKMLPFLPTKWLLNYKFDNLAMVDRVKYPVHIFAATNDQLTPYTHAERLAEKAGNPALILHSIEGAGHGDISNFEFYHEQLRALLLN